MKRIIVLVALFCIVSAGCVKQRQPGILGIVVPIGTEKVSEKSPYIITGVYKDTPAANAGILPGDIITQVNEVPVLNMRQDLVYKNLLVGDAGTKVTLVINREGKTLIFVVGRAVRVE